MFWKSLWNVSKPEQIINRNTLPYQLIPRMHAKVSGFFFSRKELQFHIYTYKKKVGGGGERG